MNDTTTVLQSTIDVRSSGVKSSYSIPTYPIWNNLHNVVTKYG